MPFFINFSNISKISYWTGCQILQLVMSQKKFIPVWLNFLFFIIEEKFISLAEISQEKFKSVRQNIFEGQLVTEEIGTLKLIAWYWIFFRHLNICNIHIKAISLVIIEVIFMSGDHSMGLPLVCYKGSKWMEWSPSRSSETT